MLQNNTSHILLSGGGTLGPVTPLLAIVEAWKQKEPGTRFTWIGTPDGPEEEILESLRLPFLTLASAKLDRRRWWLWPWMVVVFFWSLARAWYLLKNLKPDLIFTAGGYVSVPLVIVGYFMGIPAWVHQLDREPGLANRLMAPFAKKISVTWEVSQKYFPKTKTIVVGGMERPGLRVGDGNGFLQSLGLSPTFPTLFVLGGGTGARAINEAIEAILPDLTGVNVIHLTGKGKQDHKVVKKENYFSSEFFTHEMGNAYAASDVVISRAGMGTILELAVLKKPTILIPIQNTDQMANAKMLGDRSAALIISPLSPQVLFETIERVLGDHILRRRLAENIGNLFPFGGELKVVEEARKMIIS
ncbi:MAG: UDP-N-acetylglucosamine--N-acetylmuramyl-(pentapeptide) pyrophosphoryl-undecaprenol N-acetylglucosamine transferase [Patescibacteria group bacterium]|jgi:UDP-N-acetylglucosamine--N-acetylmuramyl-(pentapeptide) pyrophosphoryl-undecaprenol N-acetylglucosamine transferase